jgi:type II secretory pathway component GspD/PulD (secretin)
VRIATDPGHNYLIIKCNQSDLPEIRQLLRELDIPPGEVELKVFQLRNLDASETAENIKEVLGISKAQSRRGRQATPARGQRGGGQAERMEMLQQQMISVPGVEGGAKVEQVEIVPNSVTNSLMVSAPPEVMKLIENVIGELEELEGYDVVGIYHYPLEYARVDDVLPLLQEIFGAAGGASGGRTARPAGRGGAPRPGPGDRHG